jgi:Tol biopolymer transport system component
MQVPGMRAAAFLGALTASCIAACSSAPERHERESTATGGSPLQAFPKAQVDEQLEHADWSGALQTCQAFESTSPADCGANYGDLIASTMLVVDSVNGYVLPAQRSGPPPPPTNQQQIQLYGARLQLALQAAERVAALGCEYDVARVPLLIGDASDPIVQGEVRGVWTTRTAALLGAAHAALLYDLLLVFAPQPVPPPDPGQVNPPLPSLLSAMKQFLQLHDALLFTQPTFPWQLRGGWFDRNGDQVPDSFDELLVDIFVPGTDLRVFDFSTAEFVPGQMLPERPLTPTNELPPGRCGYRNFHIDDLASGPNVGSADGVTLSPHHGRAAIPLTVQGKSQIHTLNLDGSDVTCITCGQPGNNDGARWRPGRGDAILFVSTRDHPSAIGGDGGGIGQELYAMRPDGSEPTRLTYSSSWATNYHANWSPDGRHIVWGRTQNRTWDVMVADFVSDEDGMRLRWPRRVVHDTTWWETHGFSADQLSVITTNTRAGFLSADIYSVNLFTGERKRLTNDLTWDEHAHLSPDGRKVAWISSRYRPASVAALSDGSISPINDFFWIVPGIFFEFANQPAGYSTELTLMDADGTHLQQLTSDGQVVADNQWSADSRRVIFRQTDPAALTSRIRILTFDDCE